MDERPFSAIDHVQLAMPSGQETAARRFYVDVLGMREIAKPATLAARGGVWFVSGTVELHLGVESDFRPAKKAHPALRCVRFDATIERLRGQDIAVIPDDAVPGSKRAYVNDPFGNRLELIAENRLG